MKHFVLKLLKILFVFILFIVLVLAVTPLLFKKQIVELANKEANKALNAQVHIDDVSISLFRRFPAISIGLDELLVTGNPPFVGDTLVHLERFELSANPWAFLFDKHLEVQKIMLHRPYIHAIVLADGTANWDIAIAEDDSTLAIEPEDTMVEETSDQMDLSFKLNNFSIVDANIIYFDESANMQAAITSFNLSLKGDMTGDEANLTLQSDIDAINFILDGVGYLTNTRFDMLVDVGANLKDNVYTLKDNHLSLNELVLKWDGSITVFDDGLGFDLAYTTSNTSFKTLLSLVPAMYTNEYADLETSGKLMLEGVVKGDLVGDYIPNVTGVLSVSHASFKYPDLPKAANDINIDIKYAIDGKQMDNTTLDINRFHVDLGGNPFDMVLNLRTPISDPFINGNLTLDVDLATLADVLPMDKAKLSGKFGAKLDWMGNVSVLEQEKYEDFKAQGKVTMNEVQFESVELSSLIRVPKLDVDFSPKYLSLNSCQIAVDKSDFNLTGRVSNYIPYALSDGMLKGAFELSSSYIDINHLMALSPTDTSMVESVDTLMVTSDSLDSGEQAVPIPANIDVLFSANLDHLLYDKMDIRQFVGLISIRDQRLVLEKIAMNLLEGSMNLSGEYNTQDIESPIAEFKIEASKIDIPSAYETFMVIEKFAPIAKQATGKVSLDISLSTFIEPDMSPRLSSLVSRGGLSSETIGIKNSPALSKIGEKLNTEKFDNLVLNNVDLQYEIRDGKLFVDPFEVNMGEATAVIAGQQSLDQTMDYSFLITLPADMVGVDKLTQSIGGLAAEKGINISAPEKINLGARVTGFISDPKVTLDMKKSKTSGGASVKEEMKQVAQEAIDKEKEEARKKARAEADKIMREAEKQAQVVKDEAKKAADVVRKEADIKANNLVNEAKNPISIVAAEKGAAEIRKQGDQKAKAMEDEAAVKADAILKEAEKKADAILKE